MAAERIDKIISSQNTEGRSAAKALIKAGRVTADGRTVKRPDEKFDPAVTEIKIDGRPLTVSRFVYIMMNKPGGVLSASSDKRSVTVIDLLPPQMKRRGLFPAGRLDKDTEGFILITDDGELAHKMLSPKNHVYKLYEVECDRELTGNDVRAFGAGINTGGEEFMPAEMKITGEKTALVEICEGKFHQIKKMFHAVGTEVTALKRLRIGQVYLDEKLGAGEARYLTEQEVIDILNRKHGILNKN